MDLPRRIAATIIGLILIAGCTGGGRHAMPTVGHTTIGSPSVSAAVATCAQTDIGEPGRPGKFVYLAASATTVHTQQGVEVVVHPAHGDAHGNRWRLVVTGGSSHVCRLNGNFVPSVIAAFIIRSPGIITLEATGSSGARRLTISAGA